MTGRVFLKKQSVGVVGGNMKDAPNVLEILSEDKIRDKVKVFSFTRP